MNQSPSLTDATIQTQQTQRGSILSQHERPLTKDPIHAVIEALHTVKLKEPQLRGILLRYNSLLCEYKGRRGRYSTSFHTLRLIITVGSLIVPALLSIQYTSGNVTPTNANISVEVYWTVWILSLFVTISNGVFTMLKMDKKYYTLNTTYQHLLTEGWQFIHLSGKYSGFFTAGQAATHENQFPFFTHALEKIKMKQVEDEYYKVAEQSPGTSSQNAKDTTNTSVIVPPTPQILQANAGKPLLTPATKSSTQVNGSTTVVKTQRQSSPLFTVDEEAEEDTKKDDAGKPN